MAQDDSKLKESIAATLRLSRISAEALEPEMERNIAVAREEMIRVGCSNRLVNSSHVLVEHAIITWCLKEMGNQDKRHQYENAWIYQINNLRQSNIDLMEDADEE